MADVTMRWCVRFPVEKSYLFDVRRGNVIPLRSRTAAERLCAYCMSSKGCWHVREEWKRLPRNPHTGPTCLRRDRRCRTCSPCRSRWAGHRHGHPQTPSKTSLHYFSQNRGSFQNLTCVPFTRLMLGRGFQMDFTFKQRIRTSPVIACGYLCDLQFLKAFAPFGISTGVLLKYFSIINFHGFNSDMKNSILKKNRGRKRFPRTYCI